MKLCKVFWIENPTEIRPTLFAAAAVLTQADRPSWHLSSMKEGKPLLMIPNFHTSSKFNSPL